jgi:O-antigen ligase
MIRLTALWTVVLGLAWYARKDWYVSLCGLILTMAVIEHPDVPKAMFGIPGFNFWNLLLVVVVAAWLSARKREGLTWDMPRGVTLMLLLYLGVVLIGFGRLLLDRTDVGDSVVSLVSEDLIDTVKWVVPGLLLFDGCRSRKRFSMAMASLLGVYVLLALYVIKWMPMDLLTNGEALQQRALKILVNEVGYSRVNMSMMLAGAGWAVFSVRFLTPRRRTWLLAVVGFGVIAYAQALTGGRMGYVAWAAVGLILCTIRGRGMLLLAPVFVLAVAVAVPAAKDRLLEGFDAPPQVALTLGNAYASGDEEVDLDTVTAGRILIWPYVLQRIGEAPVLGYGRLAMRRTGLVTFLSTYLHEGFDHPHNMYLELMLDNGLVGVLAVLPFYVFVVAVALRLFADSRSPVFIAVGGVTAALTLALLIAGLGSQTFYPREGSVCMWCAIGLMLRVWVERAKALAARPRRPAFPDGPVWPRPEPALPGAPAGAAEDLDARLWAHV